MHLLSTYVIKPIAFESNPYVLPRAAQFVKYGGANKYFQKHGKPYNPNQNRDGFGDESAFAAAAGGVEQFRRPKTTTAG